MVTLRPNSNGAGSPGRATRVWMGTISPARATAGRMASRAIAIRITFLPPRLVMKGTPGRSIRQAAQSNIGRPAPGVYRGLEKTRVSARPVFDRLCNTGTEIAETGGFHEDAKGPHVAGGVRRLDADDGPGAGTPLVLRRVRQQRSHFDWRDHQGRVDQPAYLLLHGREGCERECREFCRGRLP